jgi:hypothetical protein
MSEIQTASIVIASAGVFVAATYYVLQIRHQTRLRQTDMVMRLYTAFGSTEFQKAYQKTMGVEFEDYADNLKRYATNAEVLAAYYSVGVFFEGIGVLVKRKLISMDLVDDLFTTPILDTWEKMKPLVEGRREQLERPQLLEWFEYLYNEMKKREQKLQSKA